MRSHPAALWLAGAALCLALTGCATYSDTVVLVEQRLAAGQPREALALLEAQETSSRDLVLRLLDKAMLLRLAGDYAASNAAFEQAKALIDEYSTASVTEQGAAFVINDATRSHAGEPFEQAMLHTYAALNYLDLGDLDAARVEALQVDERLKGLAEDEEGALAQDPLARYLAGLVYESQGERSDALIAYRKAYEALQAHGAREIPGCLQADLLRLTDELGLDDEHERLAGRFGTVPATAPGEGRLVLLLHNGLAPVKREHVTAVWSARMARMVTIALPFYEQRPNAVAAARVSAGGQSTRTELMEDIDAIASRTLSQAMPAITARAIARMVAKQQVVDRAQKESALAGFMTNVAGVLTERADTRSWLTLPAQVQIACLSLPPGEHSLSIELLGTGGWTVQQATLSAQVKAGRPTVVSYHWIPPMGNR